MHTQAKLYKTNCCRYVVGHTLWEIMIIWWPHPAIVAITLYNHHRIAVLHNEDHTTILVLWQSNCSKIIYRMMILIVWYESQLKPSQRCFLIMNVIVILNLRVINTHNTSPGFLEVVYLEKLSEPYTIFIKHEWICVFNNLSRKYSE